jgi:spermidine/putrescine transport system substrate-binding protein
LTKLIELEQLLPLPKDRRPNFDANADPLAKDPAYDPGATYTMPWQSGITGIAYNPALTGRPITSIKDLFSQEFAGRVGMFGDPVDLPNFAMIAAGIDPVTSTARDWQTAADLLRQQRNQGIVARYFTQSYVNALQNGDVAVSMAWSGDIFQVNAIGNPKELQFVVPDEGALLWTDNMCIPKGALHPVDAIALMDFVYRPDIAAMIAAYCAYVTPVPAARAELLKMAGDTTNPDREATLRSVANSPLVFLPAPERAKLKTYRELSTDADISQWDQAFGEFFL